MGRERKKNRVSCKIDLLPDEIKAQADQMLADTSNTYQEISDFLKEQGYEVSRSAVGRYAMRTNSVMQRLMEAQKQTEALVNVVKKNPDADYTEAGLRILMDGLINRVATAEEEFDYLPLDKAGKLITALSRTKAYKDKVKQDMQEKVELAFQGMEQEILEAIQSEPELAEDLKRILQKAKLKMLKED